MLVIKNKILETILRILFDNKENFTAKNLVGLLILPYKKTIYFKRFSVKKNWDIF